ERLMIVAQTNEQVDDLVDRLARRRPDLPLGRLSASGYLPSERVLAHPKAQVAQKADDLAEHPVVIATAAKWATLADGSWPWAIVDEAYQMRSDMLLRIAGRFERALFVGDPGQLDPFSTVEVERWAGLAWDPMRSAVAVLLAHNPDLPVHRLPVSWRLPASAAPVVSEAFYPFTGFRAGTGPGDRRLEFGTRGMGTTYDRALEEAAATGWSCSSCRRGTRCAPTPRPCGRRPRSPSGCSSAAPSPIRSRARPRSARTGSRSARPT